MPPPYSRGQASRPAEVPRMSRVMGRLGRATVNRRPARSLALLAAAVGLAAHLDVPLIGFVVAPSCRRTDGRIVAMRAAAEENVSKGFSDKESPKKDGQKTDKGGNDEDEGKIVKGSGKSELTNTRLKDLRAKTLALRQRREAELDEYEEGRALIAKYGGKVGVMPEKVAQRSAKRGVVIGGTFYGAMLAAFAGGIFLYKTQDLIIPPTLMAFGTLFLLGVAIFGSAYGMMSASWDPDKEGSFLGAEEFGDNVKVIGEGFRRTTMQNEYDKALKQRSERRKLLAAKEQKKQELLKK